ncbi:MAG: carbohydrate ABC transporter permease [Phycisphaerales bacterium]|nr:carbohydrate ABC transporter permease [Phycisphaerales bacterium]
MKRAPGETVLTKRTGRPRAPFSRAALYAMLILVSLVFAAPLIWMVSTSLKPAEETLSTELRLLPSEPAKIPEYAVRHYTEAWTDPIVDFPLYLRNTLIVAALSVSGVVVSSTIAAYGFARLRFRGRKICFVVVLATMMIPFPVLMAPLYVIFKELGWIGSFRPLWVPAWFGHAFSIFLLRQYFMTIPKELDEAARIDGCGHIGIFTRIILPLSRPAIAVVALFYFIFVWNDFLGPLIFLQHRDQFTLALGLQAYQSQAGATSWNLLMAASVMVILPVLVLFFLTQRTFVEGIATQGLKE